jgi:hypothetical protein
LFGEILNMALPSQSERARTAQGPRKYARKDRARTAQGLRKDRARTRIFVSIRYNNISLVHVNFAYENTTILTMHILCILKCCSMVATTVFFTRGSVPMSVHGEAARLPQRASKRSKAPLRSGPASGLQTPPITIFEQNGHQRIHRGSESPDT